jgi:3-hydroxyisobutyrate dehydrogenase-like beta-hydroxyacid dehydrogenase
MDDVVTFIGFGEAGSSFAGALEWAGSARAFDINHANKQETGVVVCATSAEAIAGSKLIISVVTAEAAVDAARDASTHLAVGALYFDMNSVSPGSKREAASIIEAVGARYVDAAIMAPVQPARLSVPILLSGPSGKEACEALSALGFSNVQTVGDEVGQAATIKMLRSVMYKGVEALTAECLLACERAGVTGKVLESFGNNDWATSADYRLDRMLVHGTRRAAEMAEAVKTLTELGIEPLMTRGTVKRQAELGALGLKQLPEGLAMKLKTLVSRA